jgi:pimeloyl-ACP methyl ester carboxylesterase
LYADAVVDVADALELDDFVLVGHSLGGAVSALAADRLAGRVSSLMLLAPAGFGPLPLAEFANVKPVRDLLSRGLPFALANPVLLNFFYAAQVSGGKLAPWSMQKRMFRNAVRVRHGAVFGVDCLARHSRDVRTGAFAVRPSRYDGPVSVLWGDRDRLVSPKHAENVPLAFPQAKVDIWKGMAHHPQVERPRQLAQWMERSCARARKTVQERRRRDRRRRVTGT